MPIVASEVRRIAALARIELDAAAVETFRRELQSILDYIGMLDELEIDRRVAPQQALTIRDLRDDLPQPGLSADEALANAPEHDAAHFRVPRMLETGES